MSAVKTVNKVLNKKGIGFFDTVGVVTNIASTVGDYKHSRLEGHGKVGSAISAVGNAVMFEAIGAPRMLAMRALTAAPNAAVNGILKANSVARTMDQSARKTAFSNATFADSNQAFTMRQAGMQLAQASKYNLQQSLMGNEASMMHRL